MNIGNKTDNNTFDYSNAKLMALISEKIVFYLSILTISIGIPGNIISILIFIKPCLNNKTNTCLLYTLLCALNLIAIIFNPLVKNSYIFIHYNIPLPFDSDALIETILLQMLSWFQVLITFDRFIAVVYPIKGVRIMSKKWVLYSIILGMFIVIIGLNSLFIISDKFNYKVRKRIYFYIQIIKVSMQVFIPYLIIVILDSIAIIRLRRVKRNLSQRQSTQWNSNSKSWRFTRNTILIDLIYLIVKLPSAIFDFYLIYIIVNMLFEHVASNFLLIFHVFSLLPYIYSSFLFILFICFNKIFRAEFIALINQQRFFSFIKNVACMSTL